MAKKEFGNNNLAEKSKFTERQMLEISFGDNEDVFGNIVGTIDKSDYIEEVDPMQLTLLEENPMNMDQDDNWKALLYSIQESGVWRENPIIVEKKNDGTKVVLAGNRRTLIAQQLKLEKVPVAYKVFASDAERRRFVDSSNTHRDPKLIDILNRYELNAKLYDEGYWKSSAIGQLKKLDAVAAIIGYPVSKLHNIRFLLDIKRDFERIINLIDEDVIVVNDMRKLHSMARKGKLVDYEGLLTRLAKDSTINDIEVSLKRRKAKAKDIIKNAEVNGNKKSIKETEMKRAHVELRAFERRLSKALLDGLVDPTTVKQKREIITSIDKMIKNLKNYKKRLESVQ